MAGYRAPASSGSSCRIQERASYRFILSRDYIDIISANAMKKLARLTHVFRFSKTRIGSLKPRSFAKVTIWHNIRVDIMYHERILRAHVREIIGAVVVTRRTQGSDWVAHPENRVMQRQLNAMARVKRESNEMTKINRDRLITSIETFARVNRVRRAAIVRASGDIRREADAGAARVHRV